MKFDRPDENGENEQRSRQQQSSEYEIRRFRERSVLHREKDEFHNQNIDLSQRK
jgi:hypothetical protein